MQIEYKIFVSMPFGENPDDPNNEWTKLYHAGMVPISEEMIDGFSLEFTRADKALNDLALKENVRKLIENADIVICVLADNNNIYWEFGYAEALEKPIVFMIDKDDLQRKKQLPVLAGQPNFCGYNHKLVQNAPDCASHDCKTILKPLRESLKPYIRKAITFVGHRRFDQHKYKVNAYSNRSLMMLDQRISLAKQQVDILETNLDWFVDKGNFFIDRKSFNISEHPFKKAMENGAEIRVATMDPEAIIAEYRATQLGKKIDIPGYREELRNSIKTLYKAFKDYRGDRFNLRIYSELPLQITFRIDETIFTGIIARGKKSRQLIHVEFDRNLGGAGDSFISHFESLYDASQDFSSFNWVVS